MVGNCAATSKENGEAPLNFLTTAILALSVTVTATVALAADYEIFAPAYTSAPEGNYWAVERLDYKNKHLYHCSTFFETETKELTGQCTESPGFPQKSAVEGPNVQRAMSVYIGGLPLGFWQIDRSTGRPAKPSSVPWPLLSAWR
jgi:hypothetical protein